MNKIIREDCERILELVDISPLKNSIVILTGSNGLFGSYFVNLIYLANKIKKLNCKIYCVSMHGPNKFINALLDDRRIIPLRRDLSKPFSLSYKCDFILHAACYAQPKKFIDNKIETINLNVHATNTLLNLAKKNKARFLYFSSGEVYGDIVKEMVTVQETFNGNCSTINERAAYGESKRLGETLCSIYKRDYKVKVVIARIAHTYGPGLSIFDDRALGNFINKALTQSKIVLLDEGAKIKTFGYIADMVAMLLTVMLKGKDLIYNISGVDSVSIRQLAEEVAAYCGVPVVLPKRKSNLKHIGYDTSYLKLDISKFLKEFGNIDFMPLSVGIRRTIDWNKREFSRFIKSE